MSSELYLLVVTAASVGFFHTLFGPDHYLPFIVMAKSGEWSLKKTALVTFLCGLGHVLGSVVLGIIGISLGIAIGNIEIFESFRGNLAAWAFIAFGFVYMTWGIRRGVRNKPHSHFHHHGDGVYHEHSHSHTDEHSHPHTDQHEKKMTPWILFTIFVLGPCEPLIPILMYPAASQSVGGLIIVTFVFAFTTILTMLVIVTASIFGINFLPVKKMERFSHALAGGTILLCGISIQFLGL